MSTREEIQRICAAERAAVCDLGDQPAFRAVLIRVAADRYRFVLTNHHIVLDGWSMPILLGEIFAGYYGQRLPATAPYRNFVTWLADRDRDAARAAWAELFDGFDTPTLVGAADRLEHGQRQRRNVRAARGNRTAPSANWPARATPPSTPCCRPPSRNCCAG